jgi:hypothetical protein
VLQIRALEGVVPTGVPVADETLRTSITLPAEVARQLTAVARERGLPVGAVAREFVIEGLRRRALVERLADAADPALRAVV